MHAALKIGMASALTLASAAPAAAQYYQPTDQYQRDLSQYQSQRQAYEYRREAYEDRREEYQRARADYERRRADWEAARARYDARWGYGTYARAYGPAPSWDSAYWSNFYSPNQAYAPSAGAYAYNSAATTPTTIRCNNNSTVTAGVLGAVAGAVLGSNVAAKNARTEGAVLGALVGGGVGAAVGHANDKYKCDSQGAYFTRDETIPYREASGYGYDRNRYDRYSRMGCRLAPAPTDNYGRDYRYVRVCPDASGRYRITG